jgi:hypothetical protein
MSTNSISSLSSGYLQSILSSVVQDAGLTSNKAGSSLSGIDASSVQPSDNSRLSPFAQLMSTLQQLQQSDPTKYQQVTRQIATNLQSAAQTAQSDGDATAANQLNQLANEFSNASKSGQLPNMQDLAQVTSGHHHHPHFHSVSADSDSNSSANCSSSSASSSSASQTLSQLLSAFQTNGAQSDALNPMNIILNTLSGAGINGFNG